MIEDRIDYGYYDDEQVVKIETETSMLDDLVDYAFRITLIIAMSCFSLFLICVMAELVGK